MDLKELRRECGRRRGEEDADNVIEKRPEKEMPANSLSLQRVHAVLDRKAESKEADVKSIVCGKRPRKKKVSDEESGDQDEQDEKAQR